MAAGEEERVRLPAPIKQRQEVVVGTKKATNHGERIPTKYMGPFEEKGGAQSVRPRVFGCTWVLSYPAINASYTALMNGQGRDEALIKFLQTMGHKKESGQSNQNQRESRKRCDSSKEKESGKGSNTGFVAWPKPMNGAKYGSGGP
ncbi:unnamed protein product [Bursaphelenchus xylophilus]|uniref:(pine wood nematode) hypothetical protein n=1 Tax=Bursaphelenchus xylophilus TaxID=6326 RepID=A0A1I7RKH9_BURXY|nr:unnamed protein product [Bursaphelenchus xylophilus]CAG9131312.1 unnamed protein product [Bursaphelenchus xylophilus]